MLSFCEASSDHFLASVFGIADFAAPAADVTGIIACS
jgi:hypothetical protein